MNMSRARGPRYSPEYLTFIASKKRKRREASTDGGADDIMEEGTTKDEWREGYAIRPRVDFPPTVTETMRDVWKEMKADGYII